MKKIIYLVLLLFNLIPLNVPGQWFTQESGTTDLLYSIQFADNHNGWVVNLYGTKLFHTTNGGAEWSVQHDFGVSTIWNVIFINADVGYIYSHGGPAHLYKTTNGGITWETIYTFSSQVDDIKFYNENIGWCITNELTGSLSKTTNGGLNWQSFDYFISYSGIFGKVGIINENTVIVTGTDLIGEYIIFKTTDGGTNWTEIPVDDDLFGGRIQFINENTGWIESFSNLYKTTDGGLNWEFQIAPLHDFFFVNENEGWYISGSQIGQTTDGGQTWISQNSGTDNSLYTIYFLDQNNGWISGDNGTILYTPNGGTPVEFTSFTADVSGNDINLQWSTATEMNNRGFGIERQNLSLQSQNSEQWVKIGFIEGNGTTIEPQLYSSIDKNLSPGKYIYRLKQVDFDGTYKYSDVVEVEVAPSKFSLSQNYPNPFNPVTSIQYSVNSQQPVTLKVYDVLGNEVSVLVNEEKPAGSYNVEFNGSKLASGIYFYQLKAGSYAATKKLILLK